METQRSFASICICAGLVILASACSSESDTSESNASQACERSDVLDAVGKEVRHTVLKQLSVNPIEGLLRLEAQGITMEAVVDAYNRAAVTFEDVSSSTEFRSGMTIHRVNCVGNFRMDSSTALGGQDVLEINEVAWDVVYTNGTQDLASSAYTIKLSVPTVFAKMLVNGEAVAQAEQEVSEEPVEMTQTDMDAEGEANMNVDEMEVPVESDAQQEATATDSQQAADGTEISE